MRKSFLVLSILFSSLTATPTLAADAPTGCPSTWGLQLVDGIETTGKLTQATATYGASKMYVKKTYKAKVGSFILENVSEISVNDLTSNSWALINKAVEQSSPIVLADEYLIRFENCPDYVLRSDRGPIKIVISDQQLAFESVFQKWLIEHDALSPQTPVSLEAKDHYQIKFNEWVKMARNESVRIPTEPYIVFAPIGSFAGLKYSFGFNFMLISKPGQNCLELSEWAAYPGELSMKRGCEYDVVIPTASSSTKVRANQPITFSKILSIKFETILPTPKPTASAATPKASSSSGKLRTIRCQKAKIVKKVMGYNPVCPKGYTKVS